MDITDLITIIVWSIILVIVIISLIIMIFFMYRYFHKREIKFIFIDGNNKKIKSKYYKMETVISLDELKFIPEGYVFSNIETAGKFDGNIHVFKMPKEDVQVTYIKKINNYVNELKVLNRVYLIDDEYIKNDEVRNQNVLLLSLDDLKNYIDNSNKDSKQYPVLNNYFIRKENKEKHDLIIKIGDIIYGIAFYDDVTFKIYLRFNSYYVENNLNFINITYCFDDIYSFIVDGTFKDSDAVFNVIKSSYEYILEKCFENKEDSYSLKIKAENIDKLNSSFLSINYVLAKEFDPLFDLAIKDAKLYLEKQDELDKLLKDIDKEVGSYKGNLFDEMSELEINQIEDKFKFPKNLINKKLVGEDLNSIADEFSDLDILKPSNLTIENIVEYINSKKDMFLLEIAYKENNKDYLCLKYLHECFGIFNKDNSRNIFRMNFKFDEEYIQDLQKKHPYIYKIRFDKQADWYTFYLDSTYSSYDEIYLLILLAYNYAKKQYHLERNNYDFILNQE